LEPRSDRTLHVKWNILIPTKMTEVGETLDVRRSLFN
jgi:hypothetical protein